MTGLLINGVLGGPTKDLTGQRFGRLIAVALVGRGGKGLEYAEASA